MLSLKIVFNHIYCLFCLLFKQIDWTQKHELKCKQTITLKGPVVNVI